MRINLVQGHSAGGLLRRARREFGLPGEVRAIGDDLSVGPLHDDQARDDWWTTLYGPSPDAYRPSLYAQWRAIDEELNSDSGSELVVWSSNSARDYVFERMAAFIFSDHVNIFIMRVPASGPLEGVSYHAPSALAAMESKKRPLSTSERSEWASLFADTLRRGSGLRQLRQHAMSILNDDALDEFLLERCPREWTKWYRPIGHAMADCDGQNLVSDGFFSWRLRLLVQSGRVEAQGDLTSPNGPKDVLVRRVAPNL